MVIGAHAARLRQERGDLGHQEVVDAGLRRGQGSVVGEDEVDDAPVALVDAEDQFGRVLLGEVVVGVELEEDEMVPPSP